MNNHMIVDDTDTTAGDYSDLPLEMQLAWVTDASVVDVEALLDAPEGDDGRSAWRWLRLRDGTLVLGFFPRGDTYMRYSDAGVCDFGCVPT